MKANYRILTADRKVKFTGTNTGSWFTLESARNLVDYNQNEMIYEYNDNGDRLWQAF